LKVDTGLYPFISPMRLFHSRRKCEKWCMRHIGDVPDFHQSDAQTFTWNGINVVLMETHGSQCKSEWEDALLIHEAYHVVCNHLRELGETDAGEETVAYMIQCTAGALIEAHHAWLEKKNGSVQQG